MKLFNVTNKEISNKMFNIFVGISLGNKLLTPKLAKKYVKWAHQNTKDNALILIADEIDIINWQIFRELSEKEAAKKVKFKAFGIASMFEKAKRELYKDNNDPTFITKIHTIFWSDIRNEGYEELRKILETQFNTNKLFKEKVLYFVNKYLELRDYIATDKQKDQLASYIINELPTLIGGIYWDKTLYNLILYPTYIDSGMSDFVLEIRSGKYFDANLLQLRQICVLAEDYLEKPSLPIK
jgi:tRNA-dependent cyclodipeptide synthase